MEAIHRCHSETGSVYSKGKCMCVFVPLVPGIQWYISPDPAESVAPGDHLSAEEEEEEKGDWEIYQSVIWIHLHSSCR